MLGEEGQIMAVCTNKLLLVLLAVAALLIAQVHRCTAVSDCEPRHGDPEDTCAEIGGEASFSCLLPPGIYWEWVHKVPGTQRYTPISLKTDLTEIDAPYRVKIRNIKGSEWSELIVVNITQAMDSGKYKCEYGQTGSCPAELRVASTLPQSLDTKSINGTLSLKEMLVTAEAKGFKATPGVTLILYVNGDKVKEQPPLPPAGCPKTEAKLLYNLTKDQKESEKLKLTLHYSHPVRGTEVVLDTLMPEASSDPGGDNTKMVFVSIGVVVGVIIIILIIICCCYRCRQRKPPNDDTESKTAEQKKAKSLLLRDKPPTPTTGSTAGKIRMEDLNLTGKKPESAGLLTAENKTRDSDSSRYSAKELEEKLKRSDLSHGPSGDEEQCAATYSTLGETADPHRLNGNTYETIPSFKFTSPEDTIGSGEDESFTENSPSSGERSPIRSEDSWVKVDSPRRARAGRVGDGDQPKEKESPEAQQKSPLFQQFMEDLGNKSSGKQFK